MYKTIIALFAATLFTIGAVAPAVACGGKNKTTSKEGKKGDKSKAAKSKDAKSPKSPKA